MENTGILVYCITEEFNGFDGQLPAIEGLDGGSPLYAVTAGGLSAVVSDVPLEEYGGEKMAENGENIEWLKEKAARFMEIVMEVMARTSVIPMKFLTIFLTEDRVVESLEAHRADFSEAFGRISGRDEYSVKIYCDESAYKEATLAEEVRNFEDSLAGKPKGAAFFLKKKFETELDEKLRGRICGLTNGFAEALSALASDMKINKNLAKEMTGVAIPMVLNCAFLVGAGQREAFAGEIEKIRNRYGKSGFLIELSGPWPPYSFC